MAKFDSVITLAEGEPIAYDELARARATLGNHVLARRKRSRALKVECN